jgi:hypothetical protein
MLEQGLLALHPWKMAKATITIKIKPRTGD